MAALRGVLVCCTGIPQVRRSEIEARVTQLGGLFSRDFTRDVTHLIASDVGSRKYRVAVRLSTHVVTPSWVAACAEAQQRLDEAGYALPPLSGLVISVTGFELDERSRMQRMIESNGGQYSADLSRTCTHLLARLPTGRKYEYACRWSLHVCSAAWLDTCVSTRVCVDETSFPVVQAEVTSMPQRVASPRPAAARPLAGVHILLTEAAAASSQVRAAAATCGASFATQLSPEVRYVVTEGALPPALLAVLRDGYSTQDAEQRAAVVSSAWLLDCATQRRVLDTKPYVQVLDEPSPSAPGVSSCMTVLSPEFAPPRDRSPSPSGGVSPASEAGPILPVATALSGCTFNSSLFRLSMYDESDALRQVLARVQRLGGRLDNSAQDVDYMVAPHGVPDVAAMLAKASHQCPHAKVVTMEWLEVNEAAAPELIPADASPIFTPMRHRVPFPTMQHDVVSVTGFVDPQRLIMKTVIRALGARYTDTLGRRSNTVLIAAKPFSGAKYDRACAWSIAVTEDVWLDMCLSAGSRVPPASVRARDSTPSLSMTGSPSPSSVSKVDSHGASLVAGTRERTADAASSSAVVPQFDTGEALSLLECREAMPPSGSSGVAGRSATLFAGVVALLHPHLGATALAELRSLLHDRGGIVAAELDDTVSHVVCDAKISKADKLLRLVRQTPSVTSVHPAWIRLSCSKDRLQDPTLFPPAYDPLRTLGLASAAEPRSDASAPVAKPSAPAASGPAASGPAASASVTVTDPFAFPDADAETAAAPPRVTGTPNLTATVTANGTRRHAEDAELQQALERLRAAAERPYAHATRARGRKRTRVSAVATNPPRDAPVAEPPTAKRKRASAATASVATRSSDDPGALSLKRMLEEPAVEPSGQPEKKRTRRVTRSELEREESFTRPKAHAGLLAASQVPGERSQGDAGTEPGDADRAQAGSSAAATARAAASTVGASGARSAGDEDEASAAAHALSTPGRTAALRRSSRLGGGSGIDSSAGGAGRGVAASATLDAELADANDVYVESQIPMYFDPSEQDRRSRIHQRSASRASVGMSSPGGASESQRVDHVAQLEAGLDSLFRVVHTHTKRTSRLDSAGGDSDEEENDEDQDDDEDDDEDGGADEDGDDQADGDATAAAAGVADSKKETERDLDDQAGKGDEEAVGGAITAASNAGAGGDGGRSRRRATGDQENTARGNGSICDDVPTSTTKQSNPARGNGAVGTRKMPTRRVRRSSSTIAGSAVSDVAEEDASAMPVGTQTRHRVVSHRVQFSGGSSKQRAEWAVQVKRLGGLVYEDSSYDARCTHIIMDKPKRSVKFLAACAAGRWVLRPSYITASTAAGHWVEPAAHEWASSCDDVATEVAALAATAGRWRRFVKHNGQAAFATWRVLLHIKADRRDGLRQMLEAGGATIVKAHPPFDRLLVPAAEVTHAIFDSDRAEASPEHVHVVRNRFQVAAVITSDYVTDFLLLPKPPSPDKYCVFLPGENKRRPSSSKTVKRGQAVRRSSRASVASTSTTSRRRKR